MQAPRCSRELRSHKLDGRRRVHSFFPPLIYEMDLIYPASPLPAAFGFGTVSLAASPVISRAPRLKVRY